MAWGMTGGRGRGCAPTCPSATTRLHLSLHIYNHTHLPMPAHYPSVTARPRPFAIEDMGVLQLLRRTPTLPPPAHTPTHMPMPAHAVTHSLRPRPYVSQLSHE